MYTEVHLLTIPISNCEQAVAEMNAFLRGHKIIAVTKEFVATGENSFYSIIAEYIDTSFAPAADKGTASVDYKEVLKPEVFELFSYLRDERKKLAEQAGIPVYAVVTNAQLAFVKIGHPCPIFTTSLTKAIPLSNIATAWNQRRPWRC